MPDYSDKSSPSYDPTLDPKSPEYDKEAAAYMNNEEYDYAASGNDITGQSMDTYPELKDQFSHNEHLVSKDENEYDDGLGKLVGGPGFLDALPQTQDTRTAPRDFFLDAFLGQWPTGLPLQSLFAVMFSIPEVIKYTVLENLGEYPLKINDLAQDNARKLISSFDKLRWPYGCMWAQTVGIPVEQSVIDTIGPNNRGFIKGPIMQQRQAFAPLNIEFLETNISFIDMILRPWAVISQHKGFIARNWNSEFPGLPDPKTRVTADMFVVNFAKIPPKLESKGKAGNYESSRGMQPRKIWYFSDCVPVNIGQERYSYEPDTGPDRRDTEWNFRRYQVLQPHEFIQTMTELDANQESESKEFWDNHKQTFKSSRKASRRGLFG